MKKQKVIITGSNGFLGSFLAHTLKSEFDVVGIDIQNTGKTENYFQVNLLADNLISELESSSADVFIHLASIMANANNLNDVSVINKNNLMSFNVANLALRLNCKHFINFSSSSVYPNIDGEFSEESIINPALNSDAFYGLSKFNSEIIIDKVLLNKCNTTHLRCSMIYGDGVDQSRIWPVMEKELKENNTITVFGNGERLINQTHVSSLPKVVCKIISDSIFGKYNINDETISLLSLAERKINEKGNSESKIVLKENGNRNKFVLNSKLYSSK